MYLALGLGAIVVIALLVQMGKSNVPEQFEDDGAIILGDPDAPVTAFLFEEYKCPICADYEEEGYSQAFYDQYVATGQVRLVVKLVVFIGDDSWNAAVGSQCVAEAVGSEAWRGFHHALYANQGPESQAWATKAYVRSVVESWGGMDMSTYDACVADADGHVKVIEKSNKEFQTWIGGTPKMAINGEVFNAFSTQDIDAAIQKAL